MPKKVCPNGHIYDSSIYGEECPLCPKGDNEAQFGSTTGNIGGMPPFDHEQVGSAGGTKVTAPAHPDSAPMGGAPMGGAPVFGGADAVGNTIAKPRQGMAGNAHPVKSPGTVIRPAKGGASTGGRKLVGFLVTFNRNPLGKAYNIYEGKNYIGRDRSCDISVPEDNQISGRHMSILYRNVDNKFKFRDEQSSNGTFVNKELLDEGELQNYDIIRLGGTVFIFIAIPKLG